MQVMRVQVHLAFLGIASKLWTGVGTLVYPALQLPFFTSWACFSTPITQKPIIQEEFDYALLSSIENVDQGSLPSGLLHAEPSGANTLLFPRVGDILPRLCFQGSRPLQDRAPLPLLGIWKGVKLLNLAGMAQDVRKTMATRA